MKDRIRFAVMGNHDVHTDGGAPLEAYMGSAAVRDGRTWFSDDLGPWHVIVLDGNCGLLGRKCNERSDQAKWLRDDLAANSARCTVALLHQPLFSSGSHGPTARFDRCGTPCTRAASTSCSTAMITTTSASAPRIRTERRTPRAASCEIIAGTGGAELESFKKPRPNSMVRIDDTYGVLEVTLLADGWSSQLVGVDGSVRDQAAGTCH